VTGTTHVFETTDDLRAEIIDARVFGGMHFRNSVEIGARMGEQVADWVAYVSDTSSEPWRRTMTILSAADASSRSPVQSA